MRVGRACARCVASQATQRVRYKEPGRGRARYSKIRSRKKRAPAAFRSAPAAHCRCVDLRRRSNSRTYTQPLALPRLQPRHDALRPGSGPSHAECRGGWSASPGAHTKPRVSGASDSTPLFRISTHQARQGGKQGRTVKRPCAPHAGRSRSMSLGSCTSSGIRSPW